MPPRRASAAATTERRNRCRQLRNGVTVADLAASLVGPVPGARAEAQQETGQDATGTVVDLGARITNLKSEEAALRTLLSRAGSIAAILEVQDQLFGVEGGEIQQLGAEQGSLVDRVTYATLSVDLTPLAPFAPEPVRENAFLRAISLALHNSWVGTRAVLLAIGWAFPLVVVGLLGLAGWRLRRRWSSRRPPACTQPQRGRCSFAASRSSSAQRHAPPFHRVLCPNTRSVDAAKAWIALIPIDLLSHGQSPQHGAQLVAEPDVAAQLTAISGRGRARRARPARPRTLPRRPYRAR